MADDLVKRLREAADDEHDWAVDQDFWHEEILREAADRIEDLEREVERRIEPEQVEKLIEMAEPIMAELYAAACADAKEAKAREAALDALAAYGQAHDAYEAQLKAEAKLAEVEKEREKDGEEILDLRFNLEAAEATVAKLTAQVEAMRGALEPFALMSIKGVVKQVTGYVTITTVAEYFHRAALTTENQTNG